MAATSLQSHVAGAEQERGGRAFRVAFLALPGFSLMALGAAVEPLRATNGIVDRRAYDWRLVGRRREPVAAFNEVEVRVAHGIGDAPPADLTVVVASDNMAAYWDRAVFGWLYRQHALRRLVGAISNGTLVLARAGLLSGRRAAINWESQRTLAEEFPDVEVRSDLYCLDRGVLTAAGGSAAMDMMLALVAVREGRDVAADASERILHGPVRPSADMQNQGVRWRYQISDRRLVNAIRLMEENKATTLRIPAIADVVGVSERQLERLFMSEFGNSPSDFYLGLRLKAARDWLLNSTEGLEAIAARTGFCNLPHFSRSFKICYGTPPSAVRRSRDRARRRLHARP
jgi:transcriptional regulator GlxA family with amidase domain